uniref:Uncharacterized protein n=1 Tax=Ciona intestinalis TaxID=7719 RepID=H2XJY7_CIOIN
MLNINFYFVFRQVCRVQILTTTQQIICC